MSLPGSPFLYYGDEIGMGDNVYLGDRNGVRTPMQWSGGWNGGFSTRRPRAALPAADLESRLRLPGGERRVASAAGPTRCSTGRGGSSEVRRVDAGLRPRHDRVPQARRTTASSPSSAARTRDRCWSSTISSGTAQAVELDLRPLAGAIPIEMFGGSLFPRIRERPYVLTLGPYDFYLVQAALAVSLGRCQPLSDELLSAADGGRPGGRPGRPADPQPRRHGRRRRARRARRASTGSFARERTVLLNVDGGSTDGTPEVVREASLDRERRRSLASHSLRTRPSHQRALPRRAGQGARPCAPSSPPPTCCRRGRSPCSTPRSRA